MPPRRAIPEQIQEQVRRRAKYLCEYCHASEQWQYVAFTMEHIVPLSRGGTDDLDNLALACFPCNRRKSDKLTAIDPVSGEVVSLFNPREHAWEDHFIWSEDGLYIVGLTPIGRATVETLELNRERAISIRAADQIVDRHPPKGDPILGHR